VRRTRKTFPFIAAGHLPGALLFCGCLADPRLELPDLDVPTPDLRGAPDLLPVARPSCDTLLGGPELPPTSTEAKPGFDAELAALDPSALPARLDLTPSSELTRAVVAYMLGRSYADLGDALDRDATLKVIPFGRVVVGAFASQDPLGKKARTSSFCVAGCTAITTARAPIRCRWPTSVARSGIVPSQPKAGPRRLYANPELGVYVAETLVDGEVRETEIQMTKVRADRAHDFLAYDHSGQQRAAASPYTCMACHYDKSSKSFNALVPAN
jgi:hypothetical protein